MIDASRFEATVKDPSPFVIVLGDRRTGKTEVIKRRMSADYGSHNVMLVHSGRMRQHFNDIRDHVEKFYIDCNDLRGNSGSDKNLYIDEFHLVPNIEKLLFLYGRWKSITMSSSLYDGYPRINFSRLNHFSMHDWYRSADVIHNCQSKLSSTKFRLMVGT